MGINQDSISYNKPPFVHNTHFDGFVSAATIDSPKITATARLPEDPSIGSVAWTSLNADVVDVNVYSGDTYSEVSSQLKLIQRCGYTYITFASHYVMTI